MPDLFVRWISGGLAARLRGRLEPVQPGSVHRSASRQPLHTSGQATATRRPESGCCTARVRTSVIHPSHATCDVDVGQRAEFGVPGEPVTGDRPVRSRCLPRFPYMGRRSSRIVRSIASRHRHGGSGNGRAQPLREPARGSIRNPPWVPHCNGPHGWCRWGFPCEWITLGLRYQAATLRTGPLCGGPGWNLTGPESCSCTSSAVSDPGHSDC